MIPDSDDLLAPIDALVNELNIFSFARAVAVTHDDALVLVLPLESSNQLGNGHSASVRFISALMSSPPTMKSDVKKSHS